MEIAWWFSRPLSVLLSRIRSPSVVKNQKSKLRRAAHRNRGFTLVELMITIAVVGIMLAVGGTIIRNPRNVRALEGSSAGFQQLSQRARNRAMSTGNAVVMRVDSHRPVSDLITSEMIGNGSGNSQIQIFELAGADCDALRPSSPLIDPIVLDPSAPRAPYRHGVLTRLAPSNASANQIELCFLPTGRMVDADSGREFENIGASPFGGRVLFEFRALGCYDALCQAMPGSRTVAINSNGMAEEMPHNFDLGSL
jgi:prepilin-type N-terminal cleavage/methylation domain-containing protein